MTRELRAVFLIAIAAVILSSVPYIYGIAHAPQGYAFTGFTHNIDDAAVYLSWTQQAADGNFFIRNLFTDEQQSGKPFNLLFLAMGLIARLTALSPAVVFHIARAALAIALAWYVWRFSKLFIRDPRTRVWAVALVCFSSGIGWMFPGAKAPNGPVDTWQPEAVTFLSIYLNPLFLAGLILMLGAFYHLILADRTRRAREAAFAGIYMLLLANIHSYDIITAATIWTIYILMMQITRRRFDLRLIALSALSGAIALPTFGYQLWVYAVDSVYYARANTIIASPPIGSFLAGFGLLALGAVAFIASAASKKLRTTIGLEDIASKLPLAVWAAVGFAMPYLPIAQQRKLIMGVHIPLCILSAIMLAALIARLPGTLRRLVPAAIFLLTLGSNIAFLANDIKLLREYRTVTIYPAYISTSALSAIAYLKLHSSPNEATFADPMTSLFVPALAARPVFYGHWSETPQFAAKLGVWASFADKNTDPELKKQAITDSGATWLIIDKSAGIQPISGSMELKQTFGDILIYKVIRE